MKLTALRQQALVTSPLFATLLMAGCGVEPMTIGEPAHPISAARPGDPLPGLTPDQLALFRLGEAEFVRVFQPREGLGPVFIERACVACHALGGTGGADDLSDLNHIVFRFGKITGGKYDPLKSEGGDVQQTRSIAGEQPGCAVPPEQVPADATIQAGRNPLQVFGAGFIDAIPDAAILAGAGPRGDGVNGRPNLDAMGRPGRFGWKAQGTTLFAFSATAANGTMGVTTPPSPAENLPQGQPIPPGCTAADVGYTNPNDITGAFLINTTGWEALLAPPEPRRLGAHARHGKQLFSDVGCGKCHTPELSTGDYSVRLPSGALLPVAALSHKQAALYSDLLIHDMGPDLDEQVTMGQARGTEFRTAPLWGLRHRVAFLHDARAGSIEEAIDWHGGEAQAIRDRYYALSDDDQRALLAFLRAL